jgi:hypothetical protein
MLIRNRYSALAQDLAQAAEIAVPLYGYSKALTHLGATFGDWHRKGLLFTRKNAMRIAMFTLGVYSVGSKKAVRSGMFWLGVYSVGSKI